MNNKRRQQLRSIIDRLEALQLELEDIANDERMSFDSLNEGLQSTLRGQELEENADNLDEAVEIFNEIIEAINEVI